MAVTPNLFRGVQIPAIGIIDGSLLSYSHAGAIFLDLTVLIAQE
jgi:hypothetical protein